MEFIKKIARDLNKLLDKNQDAEKSYKEAADKIEGSRMNEFLERQARQRHAFGEAIKKEIRNYGEVPEKNESDTETLHRAWVNLESVFHSNKAESIMEEVQRGEKETIEDYNELIAHKDLPPATKEILTDQRELIKQAIESAADFEEIS